MLWRLLLLLPLARAQISLGQNTNPNPGGSGLNFINTFSGGQPNMRPGDVNAQGESFRVTGRNIGEIDWSVVDRRREENWWHLYPFGEMYHDTDLSTGTGRPWNDQQIDLDFFFPYYGFRFNYTFIYPEGFVAFSYPHYIQPPYTFPAPKWPEVWDPSFVAPFMSPQTTIFVGDTQLSHLWFRIISRPPNMIGSTGPGRETDAFIPQNPNPQTFGFAGNVANRYYKGQLLRTQEGRTEDPEFLDTLTTDIRVGMVGARGFTADYALIVTWERMAYGGAPKITELNLYDQVKRWQNTYQMIIASDEIRSYVMFNYANINWTSSTSAGALFGRGGKQSALVGFNGGNGTGFFELPYSAEGNSYKLVQFGSTQTAGRWLARTDETPVYGGCINTSIGVLRTHTSCGPMLGGFALNVSGPCFRPTNVLKLQIDYLTLDCRIIDMVVARCVIPVNGIFRSGFTDIKLSIDGGKNYPWWNKFYVMQPALSRNPVRLLDDPITTGNNWKNPYAEELTLAWPAANISTDANAQVDITLWGYREWFNGLELIEIGSLARGSQNSGSYTFQPRSLPITDMVEGSWEKFRGGMVQVRVTGDWMANNGDGLYWSTQIPFGWYFRQVWEKEHGEESWAYELCREWFEYDGMRPNFIMEIENNIPCPCTVSQAVADFGRFTPLFDCDMNGNAFCGQTVGAGHCVVSTVAVANGGAQMCCYDPQGWLMFSNDYEYSSSYLRFLGAGVPYRGHPWGSFPFQRQDRVPTLSNFYQDQLPFDMCCLWTELCEFYYWRRQSSGCENYQSPVTGFAYGQGHFITYDGLQYPFQGKGYFTLTTMTGPYHNLNIQVRMEQPPPTIWAEEVPATVITGLAAADNGSSTIQVFGRKEFREERYRLDVYVDGLRVYFDRPHKKLYNFGGGALRSPPRNMNMSEMEIMFDTGVGIIVKEGRGHLSVMVTLPFNYNETYKFQRDPNNPLAFEPPHQIGTGKCASHVRTLGLLGTYNGDMSDDLITPECSMITVNSQQTRLNENEARNVYYDFGEKWRVDGVKFPLLFQGKHQALYNPLSFAEPGFQPVFEPFHNRNTSLWQSLIFSPDQVRSECQGVPSCEYDYMTSGRREVALQTLSSEQKFEGLKISGEEKLISCGNLQKNKGVVKFPVGNSYLDGVTVTFACQPDHFLHGDMRRTCRNGTWSPGWWVWCRSRALERGLTWMTGLVSTAIIVAFIVGIFVYCYCMRIKGTRRKDAGGHYARNPRMQQNYRRSGMESEHGLGGSSGGGSFPGDLKLAPFPAQPSPAPVHSVPVLAAPVARPPPPKLHTESSY